MGNASYDESYYCETASNFYNTNHKSIRIDTTLTIATIEDIVNVLDEPFSDPSIVPTSLLSKEISNYYDGYIR